jgi:ribosomal protein L13E
MNTSQNASATSTGLEPAVAKSAHTQAPAAKKAATKRPKASAPATKSAPKPANAKPVAEKPAVKAHAKSSSPKASVKKPTTAPSKPLKDKKVKVVRDSFTIPKTELLQIAEMKKRALGLGIGIKKSELIRAGLSALTGMKEASFKKAISSVTIIKTGRPAKD